MKKARENAGPETKATGVIEPLRQLNQSQVEVWPRPRIVSNLAIIYLFLWPNLNSTA